MRRSIPQYVIEDCSRISRALHGHVKRVALFGSTLEKPFRLANDIDIACFVDGRSLHEVKCAIGRLKLSHPARIGSANGGYAAAPRQSPDNGQDYHIILLENATPNEIFMELNRGKMYFLDRVCDLNQRGALPKKLARAEN